MSMYSLHRKTCEMAIYMYFHYDCRNFYMEDEESSPENILL